MKSHWIVTLVSDPLGKVVAHFGGDYFAKFCVGDDISKPKRKFRYWKDAMVCADTIETLAGEATITKG